MKNSTNVIAGLALITSLVCPTAEAETVQILLTTLEGPYPGVSYATIDFGRPPSDIHGAVFSVGGKAVVGQMSCAGYPFPWKIGLSATMLDETTQQLWIAYESMPSVTGAFAWQAPFISPSSTPATWGFLMDGKGTIKLEGLAGYSSCDPT